LLPTAASSPEALSAIHKIKLFKATFLPEFPPTFPATLILYRSPLSASG